MEDDVVTKVSEILSNARPRGISRKMVMEAMSLSHASTNPSKGSKYSQVASIPDEGGDY